MRDYGTPFRQEWLADPSFRYSATTLRRSRQVGRLIMATCLLAYVSVVINGPF